jgi:hypothetical protein
VPEEGAVPEPELQTPAFKVQTQLQ